MHAIIVSCPGIGHVAPCIALGETLLESGRFREISLLALVLEDQKPRVPKSDNKALNVYVMVNKRFLPFDKGYWDDAPKICRALIDEIERKESEPVTCGCELSSHSSDSTSCNRKRWMPWIETPHVPQHQSRAVVSLVVFDMFTGWAKPLADHYRVPFYLFMPSNLRFCYLWAFMDSLYARLKATPPLEPVPLAAGEEVLPSDAFAPVIRMGYDDFKWAVDQWKLSDGVLANDLDEFSSYDLMKKLTSQYAGKRKWPIFCIGPIGVPSTIGPIPTSSYLEIDQPEYIQWLNSHSPNSVIYIAFGSWCDLSIQDVCELAWALYELRVPVLWAYRGRNARAGGVRVSERPVEEPYEADGLPLGFRKKVNPALFRLETWVNQKVVLSHPAIAMFVSHCGWNSLLEAITLAGKPIAALPIGAEQGLNAHEIENKWRIGVRLWNCTPDRYLYRRTLKSQLLSIYHNKHLEEAAAKLQQHILCSSSSQHNLESFLTLISEGTN
eukprot:Blabericola_migrator_1__8286@NODE_429_length_8570_cov_338_451135_g338_i0_p1_GENE_NODE_429_length_8570_cov_338_451135_g338_i0NODE_429_length_8570_cov_338_451135_g338_i0_p1_ORF_typecomplete_len497_score76_90UDPGT/PF00201_18/5_1e35Glyco_tran_28_C/PF04101_16/0_003Glyco_trans_1_3/PF13528_6/1e02Glyco_trans_1_3/PF13528_6/0_072_NODE_429_length_8570_cov_338_451135_g338_i010892579